MKGKVLRAVKLGCLALALVLTLGVLQEFVLCHADHNRQRVKGYFAEQKDSLDVVFMGASEVYSDIAPGYAYSSSGVTSYLFATQANSILNYKAQLKNILHTQSPKLIVIELNGALYGEREKDEITKESNLRNYVDNAPLDGVKLEWMAKNAGGSFSEYLFPLMKYHGTWSDVPGNMLYIQTIMQDRLRGYGYLKGILNETAVFKKTQQSYNAYLAESAQNKRPLLPESEEALRDLLQFCKDEKLTNVVFARFPHIVVSRTFDRFERSNTAGDIVKEYGFEYLNFEQDFAETGLNEDTDFYNLDHLNVYGQKKFTAYVMNTLRERFGVTGGEHSESVRQEWQTCADYYDAYYAYSDSLIKNGEGRELSENSELIETLSDYLPQ